MPKDSVRFINAFIVAILLFSVINTGCSSKAPEPHQKNVLEPHQKVKTTPSETEESIFTVIELEDLEHPTLAACIRLPFRVGPNNTVILSG